MKALAQLEELGRQLHKVEAQHTKHGCADGSGALLGR